MSWFIFALIATLAWGFADLFYKKSANEEHSHLITAIWVGIVMGVGAIVLMPFSSTLTQNGFSLRLLIENAYYYSPASLCYIISMVIGYAGLRYLELSIVSPIQNASGAFSAIAMFIWFSAAGKAGEFFDEYWYINVLATVLIVAGVIMLGIVEQRLANGEKHLDKKDRKYRFGALALLFPVLYCIFDTVGTAADGIILDEETGLNLSEIDVLIIYGLTFFVAGIIAFIYICAKDKKIFNPFTVQRFRTVVPAALFEEFGQIFYVYAMARNPVLAAPMIGSYCIVSVVLSRLILKEKLKASQYICVAAVIVGVLLLGICDGLAEL